MTELTRPDNIADMVRDKVKAALVEIIPQEQWDNLIKAEWEAFFKERTVSGYHSGSGRAETKPSLFTEMIHEEIKSHLKGKIKDRVQEELVGVSWDGKPEGDSLLFKEVVEACAPHIVRAFSREIISNMSMQIRTALGSQF
jgi:hypothetical protein